MIMVVNIFHEFILIITVSGYVLVCEVKCISYCGRQPKMVKPIAVDLSPSQLSVAPFSILTHRPSSFLSLLSRGTWCFGIESPRVWRSSPSLTLQPGPLWTCFLIVKWRSYYFPHNVAVKCLVQCLNIKIVQ